MGATDGRSTTHAGTDPTDAAILLALLGDVHGLLDVDEFRPGLLDALRQAIPADWISLNDIGPDPESIAALVEPAFPPEAHEVYARHAFDNPLLARFERTHDGRAYRFSDVATQDELRATALYREFYGPIGLEHQIAFTLPHAADRVLAIALSRADEDFSDAERDLLNAARPFLIQAYRNAIAHTRLKRELEHRSHDRRLPLTDPGLADALRDHGVTDREGEVLSWVATGRPNRAVADALGLSERTVQKHLQSCFRKLGVRTRATAAERAWSYVGSSRPGRPSMEANVSAAPASRSSAAPVSPPA